MLTKKIAIFISGKGSLIKSFAESDELEIVKVIANKECRGLKVATELGLQTEIKSDFGKEFAGDLNLAGVQIVVLAGFLKVIPVEFFEEFKGVVVNVHPSLLPRYGGVGFFGNKVLQATLNAKDKETGITIHKVTEDVDRGPILAQFKLQIEDGETLESLKVKISAIEKTEYVRVVEGL
jgi:phosphoribosylglycinamide formyltransferase 1